MQDNQITVVSSKRGFFNLRLKELWSYRDLAMLFVKRDLKTTYKQTVLGPIWMLIKPLMSTTVFTVIFGLIANISTDGLPQFLFYMAGNILWSFFSSCLGRGSSVFIENARLFGKVYFPRLIMPIASIIYNSISFLIQFVLFFVVLLIYMCNGASITLSPLALLLPLIMLQTALLGVGVGLIISSVTTKYRDLSILISFAVSLWMYVTPIVFPASQIPDSLKTVMMLNPVAPIIELFRYSFFGVGSVEFVYLLISLAVTVVILILGMLIFNQVEKNFIDTV